MAGIYIHIPFCKTKCHYCNFFSVASLRGKKGFLEALEREIILQKDYLGGEEVTTVYFGGGTPSLLTYEEVSRILGLIRQFHPVSPGAEITLEANPDDLGGDLAGWRETSVNRLSIGVQSFFDDDLAYLNRVHNSRQAAQAIQNARDAGFDNLTIDLIYGIPTLTDKKWKENLAVFFSLDIPHLSAYSLTVEKKTPLDVLIRKGKAAPVDEHKAVRHFKILLEQAGRHQYIHYEISNFSREGHYSRHNSLYWLGGHYLGLGPSAHSYNGVSRHWNVSSIGKYMELSDYRSAVEEKEVLTPVQRYNEYILTSLRTIWGCDAEHILNVFGEEHQSYFLQKTRKYIDNGHLKREGMKFTLTDAGKLFADGISADLFVDG